VKTRRRALLAVLWLGLAVPVAAEVEVHATLEPEVIGVDESAVLTIEVRGGGFSRVRFRPDFALENLEIIGGPFQYEDVRFGDGSLSRSSSLSWRVRPLAVGKARVHSLSVALQDGTVQLADREIQVQEEPAPSPRRRSGRGRQEEPADPFGQLFGRVPSPSPWRWPERKAKEEDVGVFLRAELEPRRPVVGQQVLYTIYLYTREDITALTPSSMPTFRGFWVRDVPLPQHLTTEMVEIDGRRYGRVPLLRKALFPLRPGRHEVEPAQIDLTLRLTERRFFGPSISRPQLRQLRTEAETVDVAPLPPAPPGFAGTVGQLAVAAKLEPRDVRLGEAATLTLTLSGEGNLSGLQEPKLETPSGLTVFPPQQTGKDEIAGTTVRSSRTWSYSVVPDRAGRYTLPAPRIPYFDPAEGSYRTASAAPLELTVLPRAAAPAGTEGGAPHGIRTVALASAPGIAGRFTHLVPWLFALPWGLALVVTLVRRRAGPRAAQLLEGDGSAERRLQSRLAQTAAEARPRQAAAQIEDAWREFLTERWDLPAGVPTPHWEELLAERGAPPEGVAEMARLLEDLHYLRYAPQLSTVDTLRGEMLGRSRSLARRLR